MRRRCSEPGNPTPILAILCVVCVACGDDEPTSPGGNPVGLLQIDAWACPSQAPQQLTILECIRDGDQLDPAISDSTGRITLMVVRARRSERRVTHRIVTRLAVNASEFQETFQVNGPMDLFDGREDLLVDTIAIPAIGQAKATVTLELAAGDTLPFLRLVDDTVFRWHDR